MNEEIIAFLAAKAQEQSNAGEQYRAKAYRGAMESVKNLNYQITPEILRNTKIPGIGISIKDRLLELLEAGPPVSEKPGILSVVRPQDIKSIVEKQKVIALFRSVERVGPKKAEIWYNKGYRSLGDIKVEDCTQGQWVGICNYQQLHMRIPREEIQKFDFLLKEHLKKINPIDPIQYEIVGSYRRKKQSSGDIDILAVQKMGRNSMSEILSFPYIVYAFSNGPLMFQGIGGVNGICRRVDVLITTPEEYPYALLHFTGSKEHNVYLRGIALSKGLSLSEKELVYTDPDHDENMNEESSGLSINEDPDEESFAEGINEDDEIGIQKHNVIPPPRKEKRKIIVHSEREIFDILGVPYREPEDREI